MVTTLLPAELALGVANPWDAEGEACVVAGSGVCATTVNGKVKGKTATNKISNHRSPSLLKLAKGFKAAPQLQEVIGCEFAC
jgi:hypothetical protein